MTTPHCKDCDDLLLVPTCAHLRAAVDQLREVPDSVLTAVALLVNSEAKNEIDKTTAVLAGLGLTLLQAIREDKCSKP